MRRILYCTVAFVSILTTACGGSGNSPSEVADGEAIELGDNSLVISSEGTARVGSSLTVTVESYADQPVDSVDWFFSEIVSGSNSTLSVDDSVDSASFTPDLPGIYRLQVLATIDGERAAAETSFTVSNPTQYLQSEVALNDPSLSFESGVGVVLTQAYVYSPSLDESELRAVVQDYPEVEVKIYDESNGLLVSLGSSNSAVLQTLANDNRVLAVHRLIHRGEEADLVLRVPNDGSLFTDGGDNWHLEKINATDAWDESTGSTGFYIGVSDNHFYKRHEDLSGRYADVTNARYLNLSPGADHGNNVAGAIAAKTDNGLGVSGLNWSNQIVAANTGESISKILDYQRFGKKVPLINISWAMNGYIPRDIDIESPEALTSQLSSAVASSREYRKLASGKYRDKLFVIAAGNGIGNGTSDSGVYGVDADFENGAIHRSDLGFRSGGSELSPLDNVLVVGATTIDDRLRATSAFGASVDIAAPSKYRAVGYHYDEFDSSEYVEAEDDSQTYGLNNSVAGFGGTSAAAPLVTGVASLLYAVRPDLSPATIKRILVDSATTTISQRYIDAASSSAQTAENLDNPIPLLNAENAIRMLKEDFLVTIRSQPHNREGTIGEPVFFSAEIVNGEPPYTQTWDFGDGTQSFLKSDSHTYTSGGEFPVTLAVSDAQDNQVVSNVLFIKVHDIPVVDSTPAEPLPTDFPRGYRGEYKIIDTYRRFDSGASVTCTTIRQDWFGNLLENGSFVLGGRSGKASDVEFGINTGSETEAPQCAPIFGSANWARTGSYSRGGSIRIDRTSSWRDENRDFQTEESPIVGSFDSNTLTGGGDSKLNDYDREGLITRTIEFSFERDPLFSVE